MSKQVRVLVNGAAGKMGQAVVRAVTSDSGTTLVAAVSSDKSSNLGKDIGLICGIGELGVKLESNLQEAIKSFKPDVMVDFTTPKVVFENIERAIVCDVRPVVGTTGLSKEDIIKLSKLAESKSLGAIIAPNFALGAILLMKFAKEASKHFAYAEIIETHHDRKLDAPSGTAIKTAEMMAEVRNNFGADSVIGEEKIKGALGATADGNIKIHSVRLPSMVAHEEVLFSGTGQLLTIRHDSFDRTSFMPGVIFSCKEVMKMDSLVYGLENIL